MILPPEQNDNGEKYIKFIESAKMKIRPTGTIGFIVTSRLEKYRYLTEKWLEENGIKYAKLIMLNSTAEERTQNEMHATFKAEYYGQDVLHRPKFPFSEKMIQILMNVIRQFSIYVERHPTGVTLSDKDDIVFYEVAMNKKDEAYLITGNIKHFPKYDFIITPAEMMTILHSDRSSM